MNAGLGGVEEEEEVNSIAVFTRAKSSSGRTDEEKAWVALDVLINP